VWSKGTWGQNDDSHHTHHHGIMMTPVSSKVKR
jgi:hypothetical protein